MELNVIQVREVTGPLLDAFARLMPQLAPQLATCAPTQIEGGSTGANVMPQD